MFPLLLWCHDIQCSSISVLIFGMPQQGKSAVRTDAWVATIVTIKSFSMQQRLGSFGHKCQTLSVLTRLCFWKANSATSPSDGTAEDVLDEAGKR